MANFTQNQLVWAKVKGYPWWPAIVIKVISRDSSNTSGSVLVNFIKDNSHATLSENKVVDFNENFSQFCNGKNRKLQAAIKAAQRIEKGQSTFEDESVESEEEEKIKISIRRDRKVIEVGTLKEKHSRESSMEIETGKDSSTMEEKQENVENNNLHAFENLLDFVPYRVTRAQCKNQHVEVRTEPLIYQSRRRNSKRNFDGAISNSDTKSKKPTPETPQTKQRDYMETDTDCTHQAKSSNNASPVNPVKSEDVLTNEEETVKTAIPKSNSSRKLFITTTSKADDNTETTMDPKMIFTPEKSIEKQEIEEMNYQHHKTPEIQGFENGFEQLLKALLGKFKNGQKARKNDPNIVKLLSFLQNFETASMNGSEIAKSEVGKLLKTIQLLFSKYKHLASDTADKILLMVNKLIKKIQDQVLEFCLDNTKYMKALNLSEPTMDGKQTPRFDKSKISIEAPSSSLTIRIEEDITPTNSHQFFSNGLTPNMRSLYSPCVETENRVSFRKDSSDFYTNRLENSHHQHADNILLRKKICQRFTRLLHEIYKLEKEKSQEITLKIEGKIHGHCGNLIENYKHNVQNFYNLLKHQHLTLEEVLSIKQMEMNEFNEFLNKRLFKVFDNNDSLLRDRAYSYAFSISTDALESPSNQGFGFDINPMDRFPHEHMTKSDHSPTYGSFRIPPKHNLTPKENHHHHHHHHIGFTN